MQSWMNLGKDSCLPYEIQNKAEVTLLAPLLETCVLDYSNFSPTLYLPVFTHDPGTTDLGVTDNIWQVGKSANMDSINSEDRVDSFEGKDEDSGGGHQWDSKTRGVLVTFGMAVTSSWEKQAKMI